MKNNKKLRQMVQLAVLTAILLVMAFTPLGYLKLGPLSITFLTLPVAIATVTLGPAAGLFMGAVFGCWPSAGGRPLSCACCPVFWPAGSPG